MQKLLSKTRKLFFKGLGFLPLPIVQQVDAWVYQLRSRLLPRPIKEVVEFEADGKVPGRLMVATASGLVIFDGNVCYRIMGGFFFGLTHYNDRWYAFRKLSNWSGQVISFTLDSLCVDDLRCELTGLSPRIHQIDVFNDHLYMMDTYNNRLLVYSLNGAKPGAPIKVYPAGKATDRSDPNYVHMNSVLVTNDRIYLVYHNLSRDTGRNSAVAMLNHKYELLESMLLDARCAHNVAIWNGKFLCCSSQDGTLSIDGYQLQLGDWSRGIALFEDECVVGGSQRAKREERSRGHGFLYHCDLRVPKVVSSVVLKDVGSVYEVRSIDPADLSLSENLHQKEMNTLRQDKALA